MALLKVVKYPSKILKTKLDFVKEINDKIIKISNDMAETMYANMGIGLAANQVNINKRIIVVDTNQLENKYNLVTLINPVITDQFGEIIYPEGCLSFPDFLLTDVKRAEEINVKFLNQKGDECELELYGVDAVCIQHEIDHLDGITFLDRIPKFQKKLMIKKYRKLLNSKE